MYQLEPKTPYAGVCNIKVMFDIGSEQELVAIRKVFHTAWSNIKDVKTLSSLGRHRSYQHNQLVGQHFEVKAIHRAFGSQII